MHLQLLRRRAPSIEMTQTAVEAQAVADSETDWVGLGIGWIGLA